MPDSRWVLSVAGAASAGLLADLTHALAGPPAALEDLEQVELDGQLLLSATVALPGREEALAPLRALCAAHGLRFAARPAGAAAAPPGVPHALTLIGDPLGAVALEAVAALLRDEGLRAERVHRLSRGSLRCLELSLRLPPGREETLRRALYARGQAAGFDVALQREGLLRRHRRMVVLDMDSTLIRIEVIDELARAFGVYDQVAAITKRAMHGGMEYDQSLRERVALLAGLDASVLQRIADTLPLMEGAETLLRVLRRLGYVTAILSGGFSEAASALQKRLGIDHAFSNQLEIEGQRLTGRVVGPIVNAARKAALLEQLAAERGIPLDQVVAVGDGANDLLMLQKAGHGVAFHAKPVLREAASSAVSRAGLDALLFLLGIGEDEAAEL